MGLQSSQCWVICAERRLLHFVISYATSASFIWEASLQMLEGKAFLSVTKLDDTV